MGFRNGRCREIKLSSAVVVWYCERCPARSESRLWNEAGLRESTRLVRNIDKIGKTDKFVDGSGQGLAKCQGMALRVARQTANHGGMNNRAVRHNAQVMDEASPVCPWPVLVPKIPPTTKTPLS